MTATSAGLVLWRRRPGGTEVLLVHPGGPYWARRDAGAWSIPKGLVEAGETAMEAATREAAEELGQPVDGPFAPLGEIRQKSGKRVIGFAAEADLDADAVVSNLVEVEHPRGSGRMLRFPEVDRAAWFGRDAALEKILPAQAPLIEAAFAIAARAP
ncbi:MAG TPA: NUDIX domain-containing protein [Caulobacteraceae bacterium]|nr:NUDIX domain-containing protein [Caulobacteraceae bacterium]